MMAYGNPYVPFLTQVSVPFTNPIPGGLTNEKQIHIQGIVQDHPSHPNADQFSINLCEGMDIIPTTALHFNPRFTQSCVVRNAMHNGAWGHEEREGGLPIVKGKTFEVIIMVAPSCYFVAVNGRHFAEFKHRMPVANIKYLHIKGNVQINFIKYEDGKIQAELYSHPSDAGFSSAMPPPPPAYSPPAHNLGGFAEAAPMAMAEQKKGPPSVDVLYNPSVPLTRAIPGGLVPNRTILISGTALPDAKRFTINLTNGQSGNVNFHFDVRIVSGNDRNAIVRNTWAKNKWGKEERSISHFPFSPNVSFDMIIMANPREFKVQVDGIPFLTYKHREPLENSDTLYIRGDIRIATVGFQ